MTSLSVPHLIPILFILFILSSLFLLSLSPTLSYPGTSASTRSGLPEPFTIFSGGAITTAPVAGN
jgi:hypothetical protein